MLTIYKASAGSGKTFTLTYEYIKTLLGIKLQPSGRYCLNADKYVPGGRRRPNRHRVILAITFTNAATEEMKTRIVRELSKLAADAEDASLYGRWLTDAFGCTPAELRDAAEKALGEMLYDYGGFNVSTIDSFFQTVLRTFSREVDHQGDYQLELDSRTLMKQSVSAMLDDINYMPRQSKSRLVDWIRHFTFDSISRGKGYNLFNRDGEVLNSLTRAMSDALDETYGNYAAALRRYLSDPSRIERFAAELRKRVDDAVAPAVDAAREFRRALARDGVSSELFNASVCSRAFDMASGKDISLVKTMEQVADGSKPAKSLVVVSKAKAQKVSVDTCEPYYNRLADFCCAAVTGLPMKEFYQALLDSVGALDFFGMATLSLEEFLRQNNTVLISDTGELLKRIISDAEMPFIYERLGMKLETLLIDEFQDTSHLQWHNLRPLVANSLAEGHDNLIIGDEKQAIYRFRNSDSELLGSIVQTRDFPDSHVLRGFSESDNTNHRSAGGIVRFNNSLFALLAPMIGAGSYGNVVQGVSPALTDIPAYVKLLFPAEGIDALDAPAVLEDMCADIIRQHEEGGYRWRDILILTRTRKEASTAVEYIITNHPEIKVLSSEALLLSSSPAVRSIMSMLKLVENSYTDGCKPSGDAPKYATNADIALMITRFNYYIAEGFDNPDALRMALGDGSADTLDAELRAIRAENPANLVAMIDAVVSHKLSAEQRLHEHAYITALQDLAIKHLDGPDPSVGAFVEAYNINLDRWAIKASNDIDAVEVMTVHKSKGLERDCVHIPFADWSLSHNSQSRWISLEGLQGFDPDIVPPLLRVTVSSGSVLRNPAVSPFASVFERDEELERIENLNTAYVAFTRAARELCVHCGTSDIGALVFDAAASLGDIVDDGCGHRVFEQGEPTMFIADGKKEVKDTVYAGQYPVVYNEKTRRLTAIDDIFSTSLDIGGEEEPMIVDEPTPGVAQMLDAAERGNILHSILAGTRTLDMLRASADRVGRRAGLSPQEVAEYRSELERAIAAGGDTVASWFGSEAKIFAERAIYVPDSDMTFRPDRVLVRPDGTTVVVDYKFTSETRRKHFAQVQNYLHLLKALGHENVCGYLWYPLLGVVEKV